MRGGLRSRLPEGYFVVKRVLEALQQTYFLVSQ